MKPLRVSALVEASGGRLAGGDPARLVTDVSIDTRTLSRGALFVALPGSQRDGHTYVREAAERGAAAVLVGQATPGVPAGCAQIVVPQPLEAFQRVAAWYRGLFTMPVLGVTGSNGKTTVKELLAHVLESRYRVHKNQGNLNNELGVPLTLFGLESEHTAAVVEMGINHFGEMRRLTAMVKPTVGVLTNVGPVHTEFLKNIEGVARAKAEMLEGMAPGQPVVVNGDDEGSRLFVELAAAKGCKIVRAGMGATQDVRVWGVEVDARGTSGRMGWGSLEAPFRLDLYGAHQAVNAALAVAAAVELHVPFEAAVSRLAGFHHPLKGRFRVVERDGVTMIDDSYNANPVSMQAALGVLSTWSGAKRRLAVLGDMFELGEERHRAHEAIGDAVARVKCDGFIAVGPSMKSASAAAGRALGADRVWWCESAREAATRVKGMMRAGDVILIKGSRAMHLEEVLDQAFGAPSGLVGAGNGKSHGSVRPPNGSDGEASEPRQGRAR